jgi:hypothetical protein
MLSRATRNPPQRPRHRQRDKADSYSPSSSLSRAASYGRCKGAERSRSARLLSLQHRAVSTFWQLSGPSPLCRLLMLSYVLTCAVMSNTKTIKPPQRTAMRSERLLWRATRLGDDLFRWVSLWLFGDILYAVLPLLVLGTITLLLREPFDRFLEIKEWSFASIVLFGVGIKQFVRLKVVVQHTPHSYKLDTGIQWFVSLLVASVLVLALSILVEKGVIPKDRATYLGRAQLGLLVAALLLTGLSVVVTDMDSDWAGNLRGRFGHRWFFTCMSSELGRLEDQTGYVFKAIQKAARLGKLSVAEGDRDCERLVLVALSRLERIGEEATMMRRQLETAVKAAPAEPSKT